MRRTEVEFLQGPAGCLGDHAHPQALAEVDDPADERSLPGSCSSRQRAVGDFKHEQLGASATFEERPQPCRGMTGRATGGARRCRCGFVLTVPPSGSPTRPCAPRANRAGTARDSSRARRIRRSAISRGRSWFGLRRSDAFERGAWPIGAVWIGARRIDAGSIGTMGIGVPRTGAEPIGARQPRAARGRAPSTRPARRGGCRMRDQSA